MKMIHRSLRQFSTTKTTTLAKKLGLARATAPITKETRKDLMELTKFKLSLLNSVGAYSMFYFYAPLSGVGVLQSSLFLAATQAVAMSS